MKNVQLGYNNGSCLTWEHWDATLMSMYNKRLLTKLVVLLSLVGIVSVVGVFIAALGPSARERSNIASVDLSSMAPGEVKLISNNYPVYIVAQTEKMVRDLELLSNHVWDKTIATEYKASNGEKYFVFYAVQKDVPSCLPEHYPTERSNTYRTDHATWLGGFWDLCRDFSYDYSGRTINDTQYAYINAARKAPNLSPVMGLRDDGVRLSFYDGIR